MFSGKRNNNREIKTKFTLKVEKIKCLKPFFFSFW